MDIEASLSGHRRAIDAVAELAPDIRRAAEQLTRTFEAGGRVYACGNGGSAADAQHFAAELTGRFAADRPGFPAIALTTDTSALTSIGNDYGFERVFARQVESLGRPGDTLLALSTSGHSPNVATAVAAAAAAGMTTIGLLGRDGGPLASSVDLPLVVGVEATARIQEAHILILHLLCEAFEGEAA
ncbi:MAG: SIS domain-containing protein [Thiohalospira sp.]